MVVAAVPTLPERDSEGIHREMETFFEAIRDTVECHGDDNTVDAFKKAVSRIRSMKNSNTLNSSLSTFGSFMRVRKHGGGMIPVQPTAIQRRQIGVSRGKRPLGKGRRPSDLRAKRLKRPHNLALNIKENRANAKSH